MKADKKAWNLHFWLGDDCTIDERGSAAYLTVVLDDLLGTLPVQYRETQGNESAEFLALFPRFIMLSGGVASGFNSVKPETYQPRLLHVKGNSKNVRATQVKLARESLNDGDTFILDSGLNIWYDLLTFLRCFSHEGLHVIDLSFLLE